MRHALRVPGGDDVGARRTGPGDVRNQAIDGIAHGPLVAQPALVKLRRALQRRGKALGGSVLQRDRDAAHCAHCCDVAAHHSETHHRPAIARELQDAADRRKRHRAEADLRVRGSAAKPVVLGRMIISQGDIQFFGNKYSINRGEIGFFNPVRIEPVLDFDLETRVRGVLVNITASRPSLKLRETKEVMNIIRTFAAEDATIIYGGVYDDALADSLRVTVVATGLGMAQAVKQQKPQLVLSNTVGQKTGTDNAHGPVDYHHLEQVPAVIRRNRASTVEALQQSGVDKYDIPAFLRKQAD